MGYNIMIVDDSAVTRNLIIKAIRLSGIEVGDIVEAVNGREALTKLDAHWLDIIFADINMPVMDGIELVNEMARRGVLAQTPVVMVSSYPSAAGRALLEPLGIREYLQKPFHPEAIREIVKRCLNDIKRPPTAPGWANALS